MAVQQQPASTTTQHPAAAAYGPFSAPAHSDNVLSAISGQTTQGYSHHDRLPYPEHHPHDHGDAPADQVDPLPEQGEVGQERGLISIDHAPQSDKFVLCGK
jgi:hypothetical protein